MKVTQGGHTDSAMRKMFPVFKGGPTRGFASLRNAGVVARRMIVEAQNIVRMRLMHT